MAHRLTRIYTHTGDEGTTGLADGSRVRKDAPRIHLLGEVDELNSHIGVVLAHSPPKELRECLSEIQHLLFDLGGDLSIPGRESISLEHVVWLETWLDHFNGALPPLREFILPGGCPAAAHGHLARTVCRRAERTAVSLIQHEQISQACLAFLNRLSDFLFVACRIMAREQESGQEIFWQHHRSTPAPPPH
jgi:cob(I)alamin adenosyltransferase